MRKIEKTLYILNDANRFSVENEDIVICNEANEKFHIPNVLIEQIVIFGNATISSYVVKFCSQHNILLSYVSKYGALYGTFGGEFNRCIILRKQQYDMYDTEKSVRFIKSIMLAKFVNSRKLLLQCAKDVDCVQKRDDLICAADKISSVKSDLESAETYESVMGIEGYVAQTYFDVFDNTLKVKDESMLFDKKK